jgi:AbrB family looped-hinge helix DNA binding protein
MIGVITVKKFSTVTQKGQVTIPQVVREKLGIKYGEKVEFSTNDKGEVILKAVKTDLAGIYGVLEDRKPAGTHEDHRKAARYWAAETREQEGK